MNTSLLEPLIAYHKLRGTLQRSSLTVTVLIMKDHNTFDLMLLEPPATAYN